jgi:uncharacterized protein YcbX
MLTVSELFVYPVKSLGGISVPSALVTERGFEHDRRWMLVDKNNCFITQREIPMLALLQVTITEEGLHVRHKQNGSTFVIPFQLQKNNSITVQVWSDTCKAQLVSEEADKWFSEMLLFPCKLVFMNDSTRRRVDGRYANNNEITSFSDAYPFLLIGQSSLDDLNSRLKEPLPINRFRPSIVFAGGGPFEEDIFEHFTINDIHFYGVKLCARCVVTTTDQQTAARGKEPLKTLSTYRVHKNNIYFGQNLLHNGAGTIKAGDEIRVVKRKTPVHFANAV